MRRVRILIRFRRVRTEVTQIFTRLLRSGVTIAAAYRILLRVILVAGITVALYPAAVDGITCFTCSAVARLTAYRYRCICIVSSIRSIRTVVA